MLVHVARAGQRGCQGVFALGPAARHAARRQRLIVPGEQGSLLDILCFIRKHFAPSSQAKIQRLQCILASHVWAHRLSPRNKTTVNGETESILSLDPSNTTLWWKQKKRLNIKTCCLYVVTENIVLYRILSLVTRKSYSFVPPYFAHALN